MVKYMNRKLYMLLVVPALLFYFYAVLYPLLFGTVPSAFLRWNMLESQKTYAGVSNFIELFTEDRKFMSSLWFTLKLGLVSIAISNVLAFLLALLLNVKLYGRSLIRSLFFIPNIISAIFVAFVWKLIFTGAFPSMLQSLGVNWEIPWFGTPNLAFTTIVTVVVWHNIGFLMVLFLAGLQTIPNEIMESAELEGATGFKRVIYMQLPLLMPTISLSLFVSIAGAFKHFDIPFALTAGGPYNTTETAALNIYYEAFKANRLGYGSAKAIVLLFIVLIFTFFQLRLTRRKEVEF